MKGITRLPLGVRSSLTFVVCLFVSRRGAVSSFVRRRTFNAGGERQRGTGGFVAFTVTWVRGRSSGRPQGARGDSSMTNAQCETLRKAIDNLVDAKLQD